MPETIYELTLVLGASLVAVSHSDNELLMLFWYKSVVAWHGKE